MQQTFLEQLLAHPQRDGHLKGAQPRGSEGDVSFEQPLEFQERFVVENNVVEIGQARAGLGEAKFHGVSGEARIVLFASEALLLSGGDDIAIAHQRGCAVVIERGNSKYLHPARNFRRAYR